MRLGKRQTSRGFAFIVPLAFMTVGALYLFVSQLDAAAVERRREEATTLALAQAKEALIAYAVSVSLTGAARPGDLPCPDNWSLGHPNAGTPSSDNAALTTPCNTPQKRLGHLPWRTLGIADLRDGSGERLWYAVSTNFKNNPRTGVLNSDTTGTITIRDRTGNILFDGTSNTGVIAVIIAPGAPLTRSDGLVQSRIASNYNAPAHYLDSAATEDNAAFSDSTVNGFIAGPVKDTVGNNLANDRIIAVTYEDLMPAIEKRIAAEVMNCMTGYAAYPLNMGRYPWPAATAASAGGNFDDTVNTLFGRVPSLLCNTAGDGTGACVGIVGTNKNMLSTWGSVPNCYVTNNWFNNNWRDHVFYAIADAFKPGVGQPSCGACLSVDTINGKRLAVLVARKMTGAQHRATIVDKSNVANYLEDANGVGGVAYLTTSAMTGFNDLVLHR